MVVRAEAKAAGSLADAARGRVAASALPRSPKAHPAHKQEAAP